MRPDRRPAFSLTSFRLVSPTRALPRNEVPTMNHLTKHLTLPLLACAFILVAPGCGDSAETAADTEHSTDDGHDHSGETDPREAHDSAEGQDTEQDSDEVIMRGTVTIAGSTLAVSVSPELKPASEVSLNIEVESGPVPASLRYWIGDETGTGALKSKADAHDNHFHGQAETPKDLTGASLWIEVEAADGKRRAAPVTLE